MALIQDIQQGGGSQPAKRPALQSPPNLRQTILQVHRATNLPNLAHKASQRVSSFDILPPGQAIRKRPVAPIQPTESRFRQRPPTIGSARPAPGSSPVSEPTAKPAPVISSRQIRSTVPTADSTPNGIPFTAAAVSAAKPTILQRLGDFLQYPLIAALAIGAAYSSTVGQACIGLFGLLSLVLSISSRYSFGSALLLLVSIPIFQLLKLSGVSQNAAIYAYELLVVGTVIAIGELAKDNYRDKHKRQQLDKKAKNRLHSQA